jgi:ABC-2 type transport system permease protein
MTQVIPVFKREFFGYFRSPVAYVVLAGFHLLAAAMTFFVFRFFETNEASLITFFNALPWIFLFFAPATAMRLWAEEKRAGTVELLFTLPLTTAEAVVGKFLAAWAFLAIGILLTLPFALTVAYLGDPDWGAIFTGYLGGILMAASYLGICSLASALTRNQVIAFIIGLLTCLVLTLLGWSFFSEILNFVFPVWFVDVLSNFSFATHFDSMMRGLIELKAVVFFLSVAAFSLLANVVVLER